LMVRNWTCQAMFLITSAFNQIHFIIFSNSMLQCRLSS